ncbi:alpha/beta fold hydrolase [Streptacidiphilus sp. EB129]|uniref:alpha/beta fold hydrolase n=1 Tax=Streptacidiphilus sp. EB129 TaxID=3156262 RepID=UPI003511649A
MSTATLRTRTPRLRPRLTTDDGAELAVYAHGDQHSPVTVLLVHGWTMAAEDWRPHVEGLTRPQHDLPPLRVVSFDQRGHGQSTRGDAPLSTELLGQDLARVLAWTVRHGAGPVILVGHSMGGMSIQQLAVQRPELFGDDIIGTILVSTSVSEVGPTAGGPVAGYLERQRAQVQRAVIETLLRSPQIARPVHRLLTGPLSHPRTAPLWKAALGPGPDAEMARVSARDFRYTPVHWICDFYAALAAHHCTGLLGALADVPTRVLVGAMDRCTPIDQARSLAREIPGAVLQVVPRIGHDLPYEQPGYVVDAVVTLIREIRRPLPDLNGRAVRSTAEIR